jgi:hypothetical protein
MMMVMPVAKAYTYVENGITDPRRKKLCNKVGKTLIELLFGPFFRKDIWSPCMNGKREKKCRRKKFFY